MEDGEREGQIEVERKGKRGLDRWKRGINDGVDWKKIWQQKSR